MEINFKEIIYFIKTKILKPSLYNSYLKNEKELLNGSINELNFKKRQALVKHAFENSEFYGNKYAKALDNVDQLTPVDFLNLPPLTREELKNNFNSIKAKGVKFWHVSKMSSSGSTGQAVSVLHDLRFPISSLQWRILNWWGIKPYENQAFIYRYKRSLFKKVVNTVLWWPTKRIFLPGAEMNLSQVKKFVIEINKLKPTLLQGYVDVVYEFALFLLDHNLKIHPPKMVWVTSAPLLENQRKIMEKAFNAPVCDQYGNTEVLLIAAECPNQTGLHILHDAVHIEYVDDNNVPVPPNVTGKLLITDLNNYAFPLIRYEIGDRGQYTLEQCNCNIPLPIMFSVKGRQSVTLELPSGLRIKSEHLHLLFEKQIKTIREIQLVQKKDYSVELHYVPQLNLTTIHEVNQIVSSLVQKTRNEIMITPIKMSVVKILKNKKPLIISELER
ncbi:hypothetical protein [Maribacter sp.]|uniref:phenylacetate--CoA ligase family protein n=1 Tax=Maribacter sp. TaxID=1897614 RepID=UPI003298DEA9